MFVTEQQLILPTKSFTHRCPDGFTATRWGYFAELGEKHLEKWDCFEMFHSHHWACPGETRMRQQRGYALFKKLLTTLTQKTMTAERV